MKVLFNAALALFSYCIPKKKDLIVFGAGNGNSFKGNTKYTYLQCLRDAHSSYTPIWISGSSLVIAQLQEKNYPVIKKGTLRNFWTVLRAEYICMEQSAKDVSVAGVLIGRFTVIQLWHGTPLKKISSDTYSDSSGIAQRVYQSLIRKELQSYALIPSPSETVSKTLSSGMNNNANTQVLGYPRNDVLLAPERSFTDVDELLNLHTYDTVFAYVPTFRDAHSTMHPFTEEEILAIDEHMKATNSIFLVKKHPRQKHLPIPESAECVIDVSTQIDDIQELLPHCDALITDYSSVFFDYMLLKRPILFYNYDLDEYLEKSREMYYEYADVVPGPFATNVDELLQLIQGIDTWFADEQYQKQYNSILDKFNQVQDAESATRVLQAIDSLE